MAADIREKTYVGERIEVAVVFDKVEVIKPVKFKWKGRTINIKEVTYSWHTMSGKSKVCRFTVTDNESLYELSYDTNTLKWELDSVE